MITLTEPSISVLPAFNRVLYNITSTNANQTGFKYLVKIFNTADELIVTTYYDTPADPSEAIQIDISKFISTDFAHDRGFRETSETFNYNGIVKGFYLKVYEYFKIDNSYVVVIESEVISAVKYAVSMSFPLLELRNWYDNIAEYNGTSDTIYKPLTDWEYVKLRSTDTQVYAFYNINNITRCELKVFYNNNTNTTINITNAPATNSITYFNINPLTYGTNVSYIEASIVWNNGSERKMKFSTLYIQACGKYEPVRIAYLNKFGVYDFLNFDLVNKQSFEIERKGYQKYYTNDIYYNESNIVKNINPIYYTKETQSWKIVSDYLTDAQSVLARQLYSSPLIYMYVTDDTNIIPSWIPVKLKSNSYEVKKIVADKLFNIELDLEVGLTNTRQSI